VRRRQRQRKRQLPEWLVRHGTAAASAAVNEQRDRTVWVALVDEDGRVTEWPQGDPLLDEEIARIRSVRQDRRLTAIGL
jgi:hypothetical protein